MKSLEAHWQFALNAGIHFLEQLVYRFHTLVQESEERGNAFAGAPEPQELIKIVDGFLGEHALLDKGAIGNLERMRLTLEKEIAPIYVQGRQKAQEEWLTPSEEKLRNIAELDFDEFRALGKQAASALNLSLSGSAWFVEAFAKQWREEWMVYHKRINNW